MLVRTPLPMATESLLGYVLRLSEQNGYDTPWRLLSLAKITRREALSLDFPISRLARLINAQANVLDAIAYSTRGKSGEIAYKILSTSFGSRVRNGTFRLSKPSFCPRCVHEKGFIEAYWDLRLVTCCPKHHSLLLTHCPRCRQAISWFRPGLLSCACGATWNSISRDSPTPQQLSINMDLIGKVLHATQSTVADGIQLIAPPLSSPTSSSSTRDRHSGKSTAKRSPARKKTIPHRDSLGDRLAAAYLEIPVSTLNQLRTTGEFLVRHPATPLSAYHRRDLDTYRQEIFSRAQPLPKGKSVGTFVSIGTILKYWKLGGTQQKAQLLHAIRTETLAVHCPPDTPRRIPNLFVRLRDAKLSLSRYSGNAARWYQSAHQAAAALQCDPEVIRGLINQGHLHQAVDAPENRVLASSIAEFGQRYISIAALAKRWMTSSRRLLWISQEQSIPLLGIPRRRNGVQYFIATNAIDQLQSANKETRKNIYAK